MKLLQEVGQYKITGAIRQEHWDNRRSPFDGIRAILNESMTGVRERLDVLEAELSTTVADEKALIPVSIVWLVSGIG